jgi:hypothetical protein
MIDATNIVAHISNRSLTPPATALPKVEATASGLEIEGLPALEQDAQGRVVCPKCRRGTRHFHGISSEPATHRVAHCRGGGAGYWLLRATGLLGLTKWWEPRSGPAERSALDMTPNPSGTAGLLNTEDR